MLAPPDPPEKAFGTNAGQGQRFFYLGGFLLAVLAEAQRTLERIAAGIQQFRTDQAEHQKRFDELETRIDALSNAVHLRSAGGICEEAAEKSVAAAPLSVLEPVPHLRHHGNLR